jgi:predicted transposase/invertase (TIGR01784 family)
VKEELYIKKLCSSFERRFNMPKYVLEPGEIIPIESDIMFTEVFNDKKNLCILEEIIAIYFNYPLEEVRGNLKLETRNLDKGTLKESSKEVDLLLKYKGEDINIEMSTGLSNDIIERNCVFISNIHGKQLDKGFNAYKEINPSYQINFFRGYERNKFKSSLKLMDPEDGWNPIKKLRMDFINMDIGKNMCYNEDVRDNLLIRLCKIFTSTTKKELYEHLKTGLSKISSELLFNTVTRLSGDEDMVKKYIDNKHELEFQSIMEYRQEQLKIQQEKLEETKKEYEESKKELSIMKKEFNNQKKEFNDQKKEFARNLIKLNTSIEDIIKYTGLTKEEIDNLK